MSEVTMGTSFHIFCKRFAEELYDEHVHLPEGAAHKDVMDHSHQVDFTGGIDFTGITRVK